MLVLNFAQMEHRLNTDGTDGQGTATSSFDMRPLTFDLPRRRVGDNTGRSLGVREKTDASPVPLCGSAREWIGPG